MEGLRKGLYHRRRALALCPQGEGVDSYAPLCRCHAIRCRVNLAILVLRFALACSSEHALRHAQGQFTFSNIAAP